MTATVLIQGIPPTLPENYCPADWQEFVNKIIEESQFTMNIDGPIAFYNYGPTEPSAENRVYPWLRTIAGAVDRWYSYKNGNWVSLHPIAAADYERRLYIGSTVDLETYDGGDTDAIGDASGPMWEVDTDFAGRSPMGPGAVPDSTTTVTVGNDFGSGVHTLIEDELPAHTHPTTLDAMGVDSGTFRTALFDVSNTPSSAVVVDGYTLTPDLTGGDDAHNNLHPVRGIYVIKRTARLYYKAT